MAKKVYLDPGHGGSDPGAVSGGLKEKDLTLTTSLACRDYLKKSGVTVKMSRTKDQENSLNGSCAESNKWKPDCHVSIHYNAGGGDGAEVWHTIHKSTSQGDELGTCILNQIKKLGQQSRGLKTKKNAQGTDYFGAIRMTNAPAVIVECGFIDNATDRKLFDTAAEQKKMGQAIAKGILDWLGVEDKGAESSSGSSSGSSSTSSGTGKKPSGGSSSASSFLVKVKYDSLNIRKGPSINQKVVGDITDHGTYTIVEVSGTWGKLKSGAGWISILDEYVERK